MEVLAITGINPDPGFQQIPPTRLLGIPGALRGVAQPLFTHHKAGTQSRFFLGFSQLSPILETPFSSPIPSTIPPHESPSPYPHLVRQALP